MWYYCCDGLQFDEREKKTTNDNYKIEKVEFNESLPLGWLNYRGNHGKMAIGVSYFIRG